METEELIKLVDGIYKNILDKFNPGARQMINAGKAYLKALHGAAAASRLYVDAISKLARQAQQGTWGGSSDIGAALMKIVEVYKEIQDQQMNILKAFYVDLLVPLETNLEKDTKVVQSEQKRFLQQHKQRAETYSKAAAMMKKQRKKSRSGSKTGLAMDKELKNMQVLEEEKTKLDAFCEQSLKNAMTQERRRYGFVLERQCSLAKHHLSYHTQGVNAYQQNIEKWSEVAKTREFLPDSVENIFANRLRNMSVWQDEDVYSNPRSPNFEEDRMSITSQLRKTKSMDASCLDIRSIGDVGSPKTTISRAKSEYNLNSSTHSLVQDEHHHSRRPKSMAVPPPPQWDTQLARALYAYLSSGENQLSFLEGDLIALIGERNKGWQFGENLRTQCSGWFPLAYTEMLDDTNISSPSHRNDTGNNQIKAVGGNQNNNHAMCQMDGTMELQTPSGNSNTLETSASRMFGDTVNLHRSSNNAKQQIRRAIASNNIPPPQLPAPVPTPSLPYQKTGLSQSQSTTNFATSTSTLQQQQHTQHGIKTSSSNFNFQTTPSITGAYSTHPQPSKSDRPTAGANLPLHLQTKGGKMGGPVGNVSLHSSNDSGFSNDPPPQPEIDYSDDDSIPGQTKLTNRQESPEILEKKTLPPPGDGGAARHMKSRSRERRNDSNNNSLMRSSTVRHSQSHGALAPGKQHQNMASDVETLSREHKHLIKRTKSFWKFGKTNSDTEILEGMALWRHRDLVDVENDSDGVVKKDTTPLKKRIRDISNDSERTINNNNNNNTTKTLEKPNPKVNNNNRIKKTPENNNNNKEYYKETKRKNMENHFYDDEDGLMMKTVNRKNILKRYNNEDSSEIDSGDDSDETTTDDPYDIIKHEKTMNGRTDGNGNFPNVAEIGKKLEKLSKSNKYVSDKNKLNSNMNNDNNNLQTFKQQNNVSKSKKSSEKKQHRQSYETIESDLTENDKRYYESYDESDLDRRYLPKLSKANGKYESQDLMGYGESLQRRMKNSTSTTEYSTKYDENDRSVVNRNGNMYGPWYDLWGIDATNSTSKRSENKRRMN